MYVESEYRKQGTGRLLLHDLIKKLKQWDDLEQIIYPLY